MAKLSLIIVHNRQIASSIISHMKAFAVEKATNGKTVYYGVVDGDDLGRLVAAYPKYF